MNKRLGIALAAGVLALLAVIALVAYARGADDRAYKDAKLVPVLRVTTDIAAGTPSDKLGVAVKVVKIPAEFKAADALTTLSSVASKSTNVDLKAGEQVLGSRFGAIKGQGNSSNSSNVPVGYQEVGVSFASNRIPGGTLKAGDRVGIIATYGDKSSFLAQNVLIARVNGNAVAQADGQVANGTLLITFAVKSTDAEMIVNAFDNGKMSLTLQNDKTDKNAVKTVDSSDVLK